MIRDVKGNVMANPVSTVSFGLLFYCILLALLWFVFYKLVSGVVGFFVGVVFSFAAVFLLLLTFNGVSKKYLR